MRITGGRTVSEPKSDSSLLRYLAKNLRLHKRNEAIYVTHLVELLCKGFGEFYGRGDLNTLLKLFEESNSAPRASENRNPGRGLRFEICARGVRMGELPFVFLFPAQIL